MADLFTSNPTINAGFITTGIPTAASSSGGGIKAYVGGLWVEKPLKIFTGGSWGAKPLKRYNGAAWVTMS